MPRPFRRVVTIPAGGTWPEQENTVQVPEFSWLRVANRGVPGSGNDIWVSILGPLQQGDKPDTIVAAGTQAVQNIGGEFDPPATSLHLKNVGTAPVDVKIETSSWDSPIIHLVEAMAPSSSATGQAGTTSADITDRAGRALGLIGDAMGPLVSQVLTAVSPAAPSASVAAGTLTVPCSNMDGVAITYDGTGFSGTCSLSFFISTDGGVTYYPTIAQRIASNAAETTRALINNGRDSWLVDAPGATHVQVRATTYTAGGVNPTVTGNPSSAPMAPQTVGAVLTTGAPAPGSVIGTDTTGQGDQRGVGITFLWIGALQYALNGSANDRVRVASKFVPQNSVALGAATDVAVWTPAAGKKFRFMGGTIISSAATTITIKDGLAGAVIGTYALQAGVPLTLPARGNGQLSSAANNALTFNAAGATTLTGEVFGTEE